MGSAMTSHITSCVLFYFGLFFCLFVSSPDRQHWALGFWLEGISENGLGF
jgi:Sec-independent protein secretion pathway component TatC